MIVVTGDDRFVPALNFSPCPVDPPGNQSRESPDSLSFNGKQINIVQVWQILTLSRFGNFWPCPDVATAFPISFASLLSLKFSPSGLWKFKLTMIAGVTRDLFWCKSWIRLWVVRKETYLWCSNVSWSPSPLLLQEPQCRSSKPGKGKWKWYKSKSESKSYTQVKVIQQWKWKLYKSESYTQVKVIHKWKWYKSESDAKVKHSNWMLKKKEN